MMPADDSALFDETAHEMVLARGLIDREGNRHRRVRLRPLSGREEARLSSEAGPGVRAIHQLLAACITRIGGYTEVHAGLTAALSRRDRMRLALAIRSLMFGNRLLLSMCCTNPDCGEYADLIFSTGELLGMVGEPEPEWIEVPTAAGPALLRPPTGADDEACEGIADRQQKIGLLWSRLLHRIGKQKNISPDVWWTLPADIRHTIGLGLSEFLQEPQISFLSVCPSCRALLELTIDPFQLLAREVRRGAQRLLAEVHCLAFHYGWSEEQILNLPRSRRWAYLQLITNQVEGRPLVQHWS